MQATRQSMFNSGTQSLGKLRPHIHPVDVTNNEKSNKWLKIKKFENLKPQSFLNSTL